MSQHQCLAILPIDIVFLRAALTGARETRDRLQRAHEASQREVTRLRLALAQAEKAARASQR